MSEQTELLAPNIHPNIEYYIERSDEIKRIENLIEKTNGGVIGLTGVRGVGKSSLMGNIVGKHENFFTLIITCPTGYEEEAFFKMIYSRLCEEVIKKIEEKFEIRTTLEKIGKKEQNKYSYLFIIIYLIPFILFLLYGLPVLPAPYKDIFSNKSIFGIPLYQIFLFYIISLPLMLLALRFQKEYRRARRFPKLVGLYILSQDNLENLKYEKTISYQVETNVGIISQLTSLFKIGKELKIRPFTLAGLTSEYIDYLSEVIDTFGGKAIICIDELDKITDPEQVKKLLRAIKGALFQKNCYYLISISEDAVESFKTRFSAERDVFDSTFDEIIDLNRINLEIARKIAKKRLGYGDEEILSPEVKTSIDVISVLSGGIPRELTRNIRETAIEFGKDIKPTKVWRILFEKKIGDFKKEVKLSPLHDGIKAEIYEIADQLAHYDLFKEELKLRKSAEEIYEKLESLNDEIKEKTDKIQKIALELKIYGAIFEYLIKNSPYSEKFLYNILEAYSMLPYNKKLTNKYIDSVITPSNSKNLRQKEKIASKKTDRNTKP